MITVACVLKSGGIYTREWAYALKRGLAGHLRDYEFRCLTDVPGLPPLWATPLEHDWPRWWAKICLFKPGLFTGPVLYLDLDTLVVGDLGEIATYRGPLAMLADFYREHRRMGRGRFGETGVMAWTPGTATNALWQHFAANAPVNMTSYRTDGAFIRAHIPHVFLQDGFPGQIVSYKLHARQGPPEGARLVCGHGRPRFSDPATGWAHEHWKALHLEAA